MNEQIAHRLKEIVLQKDVIAGREDLPAEYTWEGSDLKITVFKSFAPSDELYMRLDAHAGEIQITVEALKKQDSTLFFLLAWSVYKYTMTEEFVAKYASELKPLGKITPIDGDASDCAADAQAYSMMNREYEVVPHEFARDFIELYITARPNLYKEGTIRYYRIKDMLVSDSLRRERAAKQKEKQIEMEPGKIYFISFGGTEVIGRYEKDDTCNYHFFAHLHYWNGFESFHPGGHCVKHGIELIRRATPAEIHNLLRFEIAKETI